MSIANRTNDIIGELKKRGAGTNQTILPPDQVLASTKGKDNFYGYNEIVVVGTSPEGKQVDVIGIFVKTDANGNLYARPGLGMTKASTTSWLEPKSVQLVSECARKFNLPIIPLMDTSSAILNPPTLWPFGNAQTLVNARTQTGWKAPVTGSRARSGTI